MSHASDVELTGRLKWFNGAKGYGFLEVEGYGDVMLLRRTIRENFCDWALPKEGTKMKVLAKKTEKGWQATRLINPQVR